MSAEQLEYTIALGFAAFATAIGYRWFDLGLPIKRLSVLRWSGPLGVLAFAALLIHSFFV